MKKLMTDVVAAMAMGVMAEITNTVTVTRFHQSYPYSGKATVEYTVGGALPPNAVAEITLNTDDASATFTQKNIVTGANTNVIDFVSSFGGALVLTNASFLVTIAEEGAQLGGVQLWENGPYWAECNVGASTPEKYGYYFWWGDTVGYTRSKGTWTDDYYYSGVTWVSSTGGQMSSSPFSSSSCPTCRKDNSALQSAGYIDATTNLVAAHDAATAHLGSPWRMPTDAEISALVNNCTTTWTTTNGVSGRLVTGKGVYADRSIFLPATGFGTDSDLYRPGLVGGYWSSSPNSGTSSSARYISFDSRDFNGNGSGSRYYGRPVRPVRGFAGAVAVGTMTYDPSETQTTGVPVPYAWLDALIPGVAHECEAYEAAATNTAANGRKVWECYVLGLDPHVATNDFRIASFPMKTDGTPDWMNVAFDPPRERWNVPDAPIVWKGAAQLEGPWRTVWAVGSSQGTVHPTRRFFKAVVFGDPHDDPDAHDGVQLWEGGPYWATTNIGAEEPWEYGYYFWWGDTVGYTRSGGRWTDGNTDGYYYSGVMWVSSTGVKTSSSPFSSSMCPTYGKDDSALQSMGYIDATGNLAPEHDAAHVLWGDAWRMPTYTEFSALINNCTTTLITTNGVRGRLVTGKGAYANRSIFLPTVGYGDGSYLYSPGSHGSYWSSTPFADEAWGLYFGSNYFRLNYAYHYYGYSVRPVRGTAQ